MPDAPRIIDLSPKPVEPSGVSKFFDTIRQGYKSSEDKSELNEILEKYKNNRENANAWEDLNLDIENSNISPSRRVQALESLRSSKKLINEEQKNIGASAEAYRKKEESNEKKKAEQAESKSIFKENGYTEEQSDELSQTMSPSQARAEVSKDRPGKEFAKIREKSVSDYVNTAFKQGEDALEQKFAIEQSKKAIKGDIQGPGLKAVLKNNPYTQLLMGLTTDEAVLQATNKKLLEGSKGIFGPKPTEREIFLLLNEMLPSIGKTQEANEAGLEFVEKVNDMKLEHSRIVDELTNGGTKFVPDLERKVNESKTMESMKKKLLKELREADLKYNASGNEEDQSSQPIRVKAPDGRMFDMTQEQIDAASQQGVVFEPV